MEKLSLDSKGGSSSGIVVIIIKVKCMFKFDNFKKVMGVRLFEEKFEEKVIRF